MLKRGIDIVVSVTALITLSPLMALVALLVRLFMGSPVLFVQERPGLGGEIFRLYKFRSMLDAYGPDGRPLADHERISGFGNLLRTLSLDELPQLLNVLKGDMSLVGPRPLLVDYLDRYTPEQARRHEVRPGITGLAQVNGRNDLPWEQKFRLDVHYVDHQSMALDARILMKTVVKLIRPEGIDQQGQAVGSEVFMGTATEASNQNEAQIKKVA
ncbi:MAG: sugar transferase [Pseudomonadota bacterium]